ncbi:hypothetical protein BU24DRAFT_55408 [Aaosphaeria arxii CBS 175.79]|uniref:Uncharacterized protein n=1 Tax=Aaosphaeria arxii CBS 175.79 TaxID=1450172 RepID=A0A6A5XBL6_9PLEO|nr:uncharacterized protein BU24DRAFT_55408 [Aaosphaeria arxii CBS 175.79]KAF2010303.1 hypothetical protein BU24DRAFT_55408 [Aaosphaeria arxii CBS 175.79]
MSMIYLSTPELAATSYLVVSSKQTEPLLLLLLLPSSPLHYCMHCTALHCTALSCTLLCSAMLAVL